MRRIVVLSTLMAAAPAAACLWDYDTLSMEAKGMPDLLHAIVGRFERNPPLYYEMRLERVSREVATRPDDLNLYDDAAVACDRLGRGDEALDWMSRKLARLETLDPQRERERDWYRYFANVGTVRVHRWAREGMDPARVSEVEQAVSEIEEAIEINPDAHFGREWVQLGLMKALLGYAMDDESTVWQAIDDLTKRRPREQVLEGIAGLIVLGAAWESPDVVLLVTTHRLKRSDRNVAYIANLRVKELLSSGRNLALGENIRELIKAYEPDPDWGQSELSLHEAYDALRKNAEEYHKNRTSYMMARLNKGLHPDTDSSFWNGYEETPKVNLRQFEPFVPYAWYKSPAAKSVWIVLAASTPIVVLFAWRHRRRRRAAKRQRAV